jgi:predicted CXXCH cytochrome family protein
MLMIEDYYARKTFDPPPTVSREPERRLPDIDRDPARRLAIDACSGPPLVCAKQRATREIDNQFNGRGCVSCHVVVVDPASTDPHDRYQVTPVRLGYDYFPEARFPHKAHSIQGKLTGDAACESCHAARQSTLSTELLLPNVDNCLQCHRDRDGPVSITAPSLRPASLVPTAAAAPQLPVNAARGDATGGDAAAGATETRKIVTLQCISCHVYHPAAISPEAHLAAE